MNELEVIIYKVQPYKENDRLLHTYSSKGKINLVANGSQKLTSDLRIMSQYLNKISLEYYKFNTILPLRKAKLINDYKDIKKSYLLTKEASLMLDIITNSYIDDEYHSKVYELLSLCLDHPNITVSSLSFAMKLTYYLGYGLDLKGDGRKVLGLNMDKGGVVYEGESYILDLTYDETLLLLKLTYSKIDELETLTNEEIKLFKDFIYKYYLTRIEINLKTIMTMKDEAF